MAPVAVHRAEQYFALPGSIRIFTERVDEIRSRRREVARGAPLIIAYGHRRISRSLDGLGIIGL